MAACDSVDDPDVWEVHLADRDGFVVVDESQARSMIGLWPDAEAVSREYGDMQPNSIVVTRRSAKPKPQSEGSKHRRLPGSWVMEDQITLVDDFDAVSGSAQATTMFEAAIGVAAHLNAQEEG